MRQLTGRDWLGILLAVGSIVEMRRFFHVTSYLIHHPGSKFSLGGIIAAALLLVGSCVAGRAAWALWKRIPAQRAWTAAASFALFLPVLLPFSPNAFYSHQHGWQLALALAPGIYTLAAVVVWPQDRVPKSFIDWANEGQDPPSIVHPDKKEIPDSQP